MKQEKKTRLGEIFRTAGVINETQLNECLKEGEKKGILIGEILLRKRYITEKDLAKALSAQLGYPYILLEEIHFEKKALDSLSENFVKRNKVIPFELSNNILKVSTTNPQQESLVREMEQITRYEIQPCVSAISDILTQINKYYGDPGSVKSLFSDRKKGFRIKPSGKSYRPEEDNVENFVDNFIKHIIPQRIEEIHIESLKDSLRVRFRHEGELTGAKTFKGPWEEQIISNIINRKHHYITLKELSDEGAAIIAFAGEEVECRISTLPVKSGISIILNLAYKDISIQDLSSLGIEQRELNIIDEIISIRKGTLFIGGPRLSGKSTTLYSILKRVNRSEINIFTIEDTITHIVEGVNQVELNRREENTLSKTVDSVLEHNPDILFFDTIIDRRSAELIFRVSLSNCMTIASVNVINPFDIPALMVSLGIAPHTIASAVKGFVGQKIFKTICASCKKEHRVLTDATDKTFVPEGVVTFYKGEGCINCNHTGNKGTTALFEVFKMDREIKKMVEEGDDTHLTSFYFKKTGNTIYEKWLSLVKNGVIGLPG